MVKNIKKCLLFLIIISFITLILYNGENNFEKKHNVFKNKGISVFVEGKKVTTGIPTKISGYVFDKYICSDKNVTLDWDNSSWKYNLNNVGGSVSCSLYFIEQVNIVNNFEYTGTSQEWLVPKTGKYKVQLWGAQGGSNNTYFGGYGSYVEGNIDLNKDSKLQIWIGEEGKNQRGITTFNGGGSSSTICGNCSAVSTSGGGSTDIRLSSGLESRVAVAAAGGGTNGYEQHDVYYALACGIMCDDLFFTYSNPSDNPIIYGSNQIRYGYYSWPGGGISSLAKGNFGKGGNGEFGTGSGHYGGAGGGSGYYGGSGGVSNGSGSGGSSYISGHTGCVGIKSETDQTPKTGCTTGTTDNSCSIHYSGKKFTNTKMIDGSGHRWLNVKGEKEQMPNPSGNSYQLGKGHSGNGYARITYIGN